MAETKLNDNIIEDGIEGDYKVYTNKFDIDGHLCKAKFLFPEVIDVDEINFDVTAGLESKHD